MAGHQPAAGRPERVLVDLLGLLAIADHVIALQAQSEAVLCPCGSSGEALTRKAEGLAEEYYELWSRSLSFAPHAGPGSLERMLSALVERHYQLLQVTLRLGLPASQTPRSEQRLAELRSVAAQLRPLRDELNLWILARTPAG
jgi:hypothetical protein